MNIFDIYILALLPVLISWLEFKRELLTYEGTLIKFRLKVNKNNHIWTLSLANDGKLDW